MDATFYDQITKEKTEGRTWKEIGSKHGRAPGALQNAYSRETQLRARKVRSQKTTQTNDVVAPDVTTMLTRGISELTKAERRVIAERVRLERALALVKS